MDEIENLGKGAVEDRFDSRDFLAASVMGEPIVDWSKEFRLPDPGNEDQGTSDSCVSQAWSYYHHQLRPDKDYSRRDLFARIALDYGAEIRDGGKAIVNQGHATRDEVPDPSPQTPQNMRDKTGITLEKEASDKELNYFVIPGGNNGIDLIAAAIKQYKGVVFGVKGTNAGWKDLLNPRPPSYGEPGVWGHGLYGMGYHLHGGLKCIIAKSSWCNSVSEHHIKENYFDSGNTFNAWTLIPKGELVNQTKVVLGKDGRTVYICTPVSKEIVLTERAGVEGFVIPNPIPKAADAL